LRFGQSVSQIERGMRPCGLGEIYGRCRYPLVALDEQDIAGKKNAPQRHRIGGGVWLVARGFHLQPPGKKPTKPIERCVARRAHTNPVSRPWAGLPDLQETTSRKPTVALEPRRTRSSASSMQRETRRAT